MIGNQYGPTSSMPLMANDPSHGMYGRGRKYDDLNHGNGRLNNR